MQESVSEIQLVEVIQRHSALPVFNAIPGSGLKDNSYWIPRLSSIRQNLDFNVVFISLGANDASLPSNEFPGASGIRDQVHALLASFDIDTRVYWIPPHSRIATSWDIAAQHSIVREAIIDARDSGNWPALNILDFDQWVALQRKDLKDLLETDGVHLNDAGSLEWALMIQSVIEADFPDI